MKIDWPQALVIAVIALVVGALQYFGKLPSEMHPLLTMAVAAGVGAMKSYLSEAAK
jgi:hypothetical protein